MNIGGFAIILSKVIYEKNINFWFTPYGVEGKNR